jgi:hypothetical protein
LGSRAKLHLLVRSTRAGQTDDDGSDKKRYTLMHGIGGCAVCQTSHVR